MIKIVTSENRALYKLELLEMHKQRKAVFVDELKWPLECDSGLEIDQYDDDRAIYLLHCDGNRLRASVRLLPTVTPHLMADFYPFLCANGVPQGPQIAEITRFCPHPDTLGSIERPRLVRTMVAGVLEAGLLFGFTQLSFVASESLKRVVSKAGWQLNPIGPVYQDTTGPVTACLADVTPEGLRHVRARHRLVSPITRYEPGALAA